MVELLKNLGLMVEEQAIQLGHELTPNEKQSKNQDQNQIEEELFYCQSSEDIIASMVSTMKMRLAQSSDIEQIQLLLQPYVSSGIILQRSVEQIEKDLPYTYVASSASVVAAVMNFVFFDESGPEKQNEKLCEVRGLTVEKNFQQSGIGKKLVEFALADLRKRHQGPLRVFALTYAEKFFEKLGFTKTVKENFPQKVYEVCQFCHKKDDCQEIAVELFYK